MQAETELPLYRRFPELASRAPRLPLARLPTPVERLPGVRVEAWIKRDDLTGELYGGNKVRKLEFLLAAARLADAERLITVGAIGSHHALATTIYGRAAGFEVTVVLLPQPATEHVRQVLAGIRDAGAEVRLVRSAAAVPAGVIAARVAHRDEKLAVIPAGGSDAIGTLGYLNAAFELADQVADGLPRPAEVHVAGGTLGTAVGLAAGFAILGWDTDVVAHRITSRAITNGRRARRLADGVLGLLAADAGDGLPKRTDVLRRLRIESRQIGRGYGFGTPAGLAAIDWFRDQSRLELDATYTAKAAAGLLAAAGRRGPLLYWHTLSAVHPAASSADPAATV